MGEKKWPKSAKIRFVGSGAPACVLARRASRRRDEGAGLKGPRRRHLRIENNPKNRIENCPKKRIKNYPSHMAKANISTNVL